MRLAVEIVRRTREAVGPDFILIYRLSLIDLLPDGSSWIEVVQLAKAVAAAGATLINSSIGWLAPRQRLLKRVTRSPASLRNIGYLIRETFCGLECRH